jgi:hypothetical protein
VFVEIDEELDISYLFITQVAKLLGRQQNATRTTILLLSMILSLVDMLK